MGAKNARSLSYNARRLAEREQARKVLNDTYLQAREFEERYHALLKPEDLELLQVYQNLQHNKPITPHFLYINESLSRS